MTEGPIVKEPTPEEDRVRPLPLVGVAAGSLVVGFLLVYALGQSAAEGEAGRGRQGTERIAPEPSPAPPPTPARTGDRTGAEQTGDGRPATGNGESSGGAGAGPGPGPGPGTGAGPGAGAGPGTGTGTGPGPGPGPGPGSGASARGSTVGEGFYFRCWEAGHDEPAPEGTCDRLPELERRIAEQLPEIEACASGTTGTLSLGIEVQLRARQASYWAGRRSTITPVDALIRCVRTRLEDTNLEGLEGRFRKYTLFLPIELR